MSTEQTIRDFVDRYFAALNAMLGGDTGPIQALWSHGPEATAMHPEGGREMGWEEVRGAIEGWAAAVRDGHIDPRETSIRMVTPDVAIVTSRETGDGTIGPERVHVDSRSTLVIRRDGADWKVVHHHVDTNARIRALVEASRAAAATVDVARATLPQSEPVLS